MLEIYGIKQCDTCRKALKWLDGQGIAHRWHDLREQALKRETVEDWLGVVGDQALVNRRSTTWRQLPQALREGAEPAADLLLDYPTLIKRPVFVRGGEVRVGFTDDVRRWLK